MKAEIENHPCTLWFVQLVWKELNADESWESRLDHLHGAAMCAAGDLNRELQFLYDIYRIRM